MDTSLIPHTQVPAPRASLEDIESALTIGDLAKMPPAVRVRYYLAACESAGLNPLTQPFTPIKNQAGQVILYANATAAEQLRRKHGVSVRVLSRETLDGLYTVTVVVQTADGRADEAQGIVDVGGLKGQALANARMRAETKAKRRATLALCGLGYGYAEDTAGHVVRFDPQTGEIPASGAAGAFNEQDTSALHAAADLFGDHAGNGLSVDHTSTPDSATWHPAVLITEIEDTLEQAGLNAVGYWARICGHFAIEKPQHLTRDQLEDCLSRVRNDLARRQQAVAPAATATPEADEGAENDDIPF